MDQQNDTAPSHFTAAEREKRWNRYLSTLTAAERRAAVRSVREFAHHACTWPSQRTFPRYGLPRGGRP